MSLSIALDLDNTITADPKGFGAIVRCFQSLGHKVTIVTLRSPDDSHPLIDEYKSQYGVDCVFCSGEAKERVVTDEGLRIDIWIDDSPQYITNDYIDLFKKFG